MARPSIGPRLYLHPKERVWLIRDGEITRRTGCDEHDLEGARHAFGVYLTSGADEKTSNTDDAGTLNSLKPFDDLLSEEEACRRFPRLVGA